MNFSNRYHFTDVNALRYIIHGDGQVASPVVTVEPEPLVVPEPSPISVDVEEIVRQMENLKIDDPLDVLEEVPKTDVHVNEVTATSEPDVPDQPSPSVEQKSDLEIPDLDWEESTLEEMIDSQTNIRELEGDKDSLSRKIARHRERLQEHEKKKLDLQAQYLQTKSVDLLEPIHSCIFTITNLIDLIRDSEIELVILNEELQDERTAFDELAQDYHHYLSTHY